MDGQVPGESGGEQGPDAPRSAPRSSPRPRLVALFLASLLVGTLGHFVVERATHRDRVLPGVTVLGTALGGVGGPALRTAVESLAPRAPKLVGTVRVRDRSFAVSGSSLGASLDVAATTERALSAGRGSPLSAVRWFLSRPFSRTSVPVALRLDPTATEAQIASFERAALGDPAVEGAVGFTDHVVPTYPRPGLAVVRAGVAAALERALTARPAAPVVLAVETRTPKLGRAAVDAAVSAATALTAAPVTLRAASGEPVLEFSSADLGAALRGRLVTESTPRLDVELDPAALKAVIDRARAKLERPARDASFAISLRNEVTVVPSELGNRLDDAAVITTVQRLARGTERHGELPFLTDVQPLLTTEQAVELRVKGLVSSYTTYFPCCEARVKNIERMAALVNGSIVRPGEQYSINERAGPRTTANGFVAGPTIVEGEMEMTVGGGVSQFATTLFNAAFDGGYEIIQRQAHTYWFPRYPEGHDATLGFPLPDLVFRNDSAAGIFIRATTGKTFVKVELFGDSGGRHVERHVSPRFDVVQPETVYEPNDALSPDETKVKYGGQMGWSVEVSRVVTFADGQKKEERRKVTYNPRSRRVEVHSCKIPEGDPGYTGDKCPKIEAPDGGAPR